MEEFKGKKVLVTGARGFFGKHLVKLLNEYKAVTIEYNSDLLVGELTNRVLWEMPDLDFVFHLAGYNGGLNFNLENGFDIFQKNTSMAMNIVRAAMKSRVKKFVGVVASCAYPNKQLFDNNETDTYGEYVYTKGDREIMKEGDFLDGPPHDSVACHGYAKRNLQLAVHFAKQQYKMDGICVCPTTLYGPEDTFDAARTKVMGALIKKFVDAADDNAESVNCWGTGKAMREFLYVEDAARMTLQAAVKYDDSTKPLNLGSGQEYTIKDLTDIVAKLAGFKGKLLWDSNKPDGQLRKRLCNINMERIIGKQEYMPIATGIEKTIAYYRHIKQESVV